MKPISVLSLSEMIINTGHRYVGLREIKPNAHWDNPSTKGIDVDLSNELRSMMRPAPWQDGWAYCAAFTEAVVVASLRRLGVEEERIAKFAKVHTPHVTSNVRAFGSLKLLSDKPTQGSLWLAQNGTGDTGHEGIFEKEERGMMINVEANTSNSDRSLPAQEREGDWITVKLRNFKRNGPLTTRGFITPESIIKLIYA